MSSSGGVDQTATSDAQNRENDLEKIEEEKLKAKYPGLSGHSAILKKRLNKGQKFFDSGDYEMAKQKDGNKKQDYVNATGELIPTPETVPARKSYPPK